MVVKSAGGAVVRMEDIANVDLGAQSWSSDVMMNGQQAVFIGIQATPDGKLAVAGAGGAQAVPRYRADPAAFGPDGSCL